jgi:hypothetical protein
MKIRVVHKEVPPREAIQWEFPNGGSQGESTKGEPHRKVPQWWPNEMSSSGVC